MSQGCEGCDSVSSVEQGLDSLKLLLFYFGVLLTFATPQAMREKATTDLVGGILSTLSNNSSCISSLPRRP